MKFSSSEKERSPIDDIKLEEGTLPKIASENVVYQSSSQSRFRSFIDSFKPPVIDEAAMAGMSEEERQLYLEANSGLKRNLKKRHIQMIAIGGSIGTGLFIGTGTSLASGGPAPLIIAYAILGVMLFFTIQALGELSIAFPVEGAFSAYSARFIDPAWGFAMGWNYCFAWFSTMPLELVAASMTVQYWNREINAAAWAAIFYVFVIAINLFGARGYAEAEFWFSLSKVVAVCGFIIFGVIYDCGGIAGHPYIGGKFYHDPGAFNHGFKGLCSVFVTGAFSLTGTEMVGIASAESENPRKTLPHAIKQVFWRVLIFYLVSLAVLGLLIPYTDPRLMSQGSTYSASPFVLAIQNAGVRGLPSVMNVVILFAILSVSNTSIYASSRLMLGLAKQNFAPKFLAVVDRKGRPVWGMLATATFGLLCFVSSSPVESKVFSWLMALNGLSSIFTWGSICYCHIRFRRGMQAQGKSLDELSYKAAMGVWGSWIGLIINFLILVSQFWTGLWPVNGTGKPDVTSFFQAYLAAPIVGISYISFKLWRKTKIVRSASMDVDSDRRQVDPQTLKEEIELEKLEIRSFPWYKRAINFWC